MFNYTQSELKYLRYYLINNPDILLFTRLMFESVKKRKFIVNWHHKDMADKIDSVLRYDHPTNYLIFNLPPRHTKTEMAVINFIAYGFAINPESVFMHHSSSDALVRTNITNIRNIMNCELYRALFPEVTLTDKGSGKMSTSQGGVLHSAPMMGQITGFGAGILDATKFSGGLVIDDPMKAQEAHSEAIRTKVNGTWGEAFDSRLADGRTPVIVTMQRLHPKDYTDRLIEYNGIIEEGGMWDITKYPAIIDIDTPQQRALWEKRKSIQKHLEKREKDEWIFNTQYQQEPVPLGLLLYPKGEEKLFDTLLHPTEYDYLHCQIDPANGGDRISATLYGLKNGNIYTLDMVYVSTKAEDSVQRIMVMLKKWRPATVLVETNMAWELYYMMLGREITEQLPEVKIGKFNATGEKELRIQNNAPFIRNTFYYLVQGLRHKEYNDAMNDKYKYLRGIKNQVDDFVDNESSAVRFFKVNGFI